MRKWTFLFLSLFFAASAQALNLKGVEISKRYHGGQDMPELVLNGAAVRQKYLVVDVYVGALYLERATQDPVVIMNDPGYKRMEFHLLRSVRGRVVADAIYERMRLNITREEAESMQKEIDDFIRIFDHKIKEGELAALDYIPERGTRIEINGKELGVIPGKRLYDAILSIWIGSHPVTESFKQGVLGLASSEDAVARVD